MEKVFKFSSYYKYSFIFKADDGETVSVGGNAEDIYRASIDKEMTRKELEEIDEVYQITPPKA